MRLPKGLSLPEQFKKFLKDARSYVDHAWIREENREFLPKEAYLILKEFFYLKGCDVTLDKNEVANYLSRVTSRKYLEDIEAIFNLGKQAFLCTTYGASKERDEDKKKLQEFAQQKNCLLQSFTRSASLTLPTVFFFVPECRPSSVVSEESHQSLTLDCE